MATPRQTSNILLVIIDDFGEHQLGCYGSAFFETPHMDSFARQCTRFSCAYASSPVCSPARAGIYTGRHPARLHITNYIPGTEPANPRLLTPRWQQGLPVDELALGTAFKKAGYLTAHFGKWHLARDYDYRPGRPMDPESHGFDEVLVTLKPRPEADPEDDPHHIDELTDRAIAFLQRPKKEPFFCVLAHNAVHRPEMASRRLIEHFAAKPGSERDCNRPVLAAMTSHLDTAFGRLMTALDAAGQAEDTIVVLVSDHGAFGRSSDRKPLRGAKTDLYEGGLRVPLVVRWPGRVPANRTLADPVSSVDLFPTLLEIAGLELPPTALDGLSLAPCLTEGTGVPTREAFHWHYPHYHHLGIGPCGAIRHGRYKLIEWFDPKKDQNAPQPAFELFDLEADPFEETDLVDSSPEVCAAMAEELRAWRRSIDAQEMVPNPAYDPGVGGTEAPPPGGDAANPYSG